MGAANRGAAIVPLINDRKPIRKFSIDCLSASPKRGCLNVGAWNPQESGRKAPLSCNAAFSMLQCSFSFAAAQLLGQMTSALQKSQCCSAVSAAQHSENCSATSVFARGMLQGWGLEGWGLGLAELGHLQNQWLNSASTELATAGNQREKPIRSFSIDPTSSIRYQTSR